MKQTVTLTVQLALGLLCLWLIWPAAAYAAEFQGADVYVLPAGEVVEEDLFVTGREIVIAGTVQGDLFAAGSTILVQGEVQGSAYLAGYVVALQDGVVHGDLFSSSYNLILDGEVRSDVRSLTGGTEDESTAFLQDTMASESTRFTESLPEGLVLTPRARVGGDFLALAGQATMEGTVERDLHIMTAVFIQKDTGSIGRDLQIDATQADVQGTVKGNLDVRAETVVFGSGLDIGGTTTYTALEEAAGAPFGAEFAPLQDSADNTGIQWPQWLLRTVLVLVGFGLLLVLTRWATTRFRSPVWNDRTEQRLGVDLIWGVLSLFVMPIVIILIPAVTGFFLGFGNAAVVASLLTAGWIAIWIFSPLVSGPSLGSWLGNRLPGEQSALRDDLLGVGLVVLAMRLVSLPSLGVDGLQGLISALGWLVFCLSYLLAMGRLVQGLGRTRRMPMDPEPESSPVPA